MLFKLKLKNDSGSFSVSLNRDFTESEVRDITSVATNLLFPKSSSKTQESTLEDVIKNSINTYSKFGQDPVESIQYGSYKEPAEGIRIKILPFPPEKRIAAIRFFKERTGISLKGSQHVIDGNFPCPKLDTLLAAEIYKHFRELNVYCRLISDEKNVEWDLTGS